MDVNKTPKASLPPMPIILFNQDFLPRPFGFANSGSDCWMNSVLQMFLSCTSLTQVMLDNPGEFKSNAFSKQYLELVNLAHSWPPEAGLDGEIREGGHSGAGGPNGAAAALTADQRAAAQIKVAALRNALALIPGALRKKFAGKASEAMHFGQNCANEAFTLFLSMLASARAEEQFRLKLEKQIVCPECRHLSAMERYSLTFLNLYDPPKLDPTTPAESAVKWSEHVRAHISHLTGYKCDKCDRTVSAYYLTELRMARSVIVIIFNKFVDAPENKRYYWFPLEFVLPAGKTAEHKYRLVAQVEHYGTRSGGHYVAKALRGGLGNATTGPFGASGATTAPCGWYEFNDSSFTPTTPGATKNTFMIAYHKTQ